MEGAIAIAKENGFSEVLRGSGWVELERSGTIYTFSGPKVPLRLRIDESDNDELWIGIKYDAWNRSRPISQRAPVLFDTGDLRKFTEVLSVALRRPSP
jgi:hypothetical protein